MALAEAPQPDHSVLIEDELVPVDTFRVRIAIIRAEKGWNVSQAAKACGLGTENWRKWEKDGRRPQDYEETCRKIADASGYSRRWVMAGGPLRSRCFTALSLVNDSDGQMELAFEDPPKLQPVR